jgi:hypothetical protein
MTAYMYEIECACSGGKYVGVTSRGVAKRWREHVASATAGSATRLHKAIRKYGAAEFSVKTRAQLPTYEEALLAERITIALERPRYNMTDGGDGHRGPLPAELRAKLTRMSAAAKKRGQHPALLAAATAYNKGRPWSEEKRAAAAARFKCSDETRAKLRRASIGAVFSDERRSKISAKALERAAAKRKAKSGGTET